MRLQTKVFVATFTIFLLHFIVNTYIGQQQIKTDVINNIKENARNIRGILMSYRNVYQNVFIHHNIPITDQTIEFLPAHAVSRISKQFTQWVDTGLTFNNVSDQPRNPINQADAIELKAIQYFRQNDDAVERFVAFNTSSGEAYYHFSQPIVIKPRCITCHGQQQDALPSIQQRYNTAYNYKIGDLRGLMSIKLPAAIIEQRTETLLKKNIVIHLLSMLFAFALLALLLNHTILSRIKLLRSGSRKLAEGKYNTQIELSGRDELTEMGETFNRMAKTIAHREQSLLKQQSLYYALSEANRSIVQLDCDHDLYNKICHIASRQPNLILAWIGISNKEQTTLQPVASSGRAESCLNKLDFSLNAGMLHSLGPVNNAFQQNKSIIINDYLSEPSTALNHENAEKTGVRAVASFPLHKNQKLIGIFSVYADQKDYFNDDISRLFHEIINDVEYAIKNYAIQQQHIKSQQQLQQSSKNLSELNNKMRMLLESTGEGIFGVDLNGKCSFINYAAAEMFGFPISELDGKDIHSLTHHTYQDGAEFPAKDCPIVLTFNSGQPHHSNEDCFWRKDGSYFPVQYSAYPIHNEQREITGSVVIFRDITEQQVTTNKINYLASHDSLTGLLNRYSFEQKLEAAIGTARTAETEHVICYLDLDQFKVINDTCGHLAGDEMLKMITHLLTESLHKNDILARLGGDEFGLILENHSIAQATQLTQEICDTIKDFRFVWQDKIFNMSVSIGLSAITHETTSAQNLLSAVDTACYVAKNKGRNQLHICQDDDIETAKHQDEMQWVSEVRKAIDDNRLVLYKQAIIPSEIHSKEHQHFEMLIRMKDEQDNLIPPGAFLPAAEHYDLIGDIDRWVIQATFKWLANQLNNNELIDFCSINLSGQSIGDKKLYQFIIDQQHKWGIKSEIICFEVTENAAITRIDQAISFIKQLRKKGFLFALDDFGTGMSSFSYLKNLPVDFLKIDGSFVKDIIDDPIDHAMVKSINDIGHIMGLKTIAEYVENEEIQNELIHMGVDYLQGYGLAKPEPCDK